MQKKITITLDISCSGKVKQEEIDCFLDDICKDMVEIDYIRGGVNGSITIKIISANYQTGVDK